MIMKKIRKEILMQGTFLANAKGFGFVRAEGLEKDLFIPEGLTGTALDGDLVEVCLLPSFDGNVIPDGKDGRGCPDCCKEYDLTCRYFLWKGRQRKRDSG